MDDLKISDLDVLNREPGSVKELFVALTNLENPIENVWVEDLLLKILFAGPTYEDQSLSRYERAGGATSRSGENTLAYFCEEFLCEPRSLEILKNSEFERVYTCASGSMASHAMNYLAHGTSSKFQSKQGRDTSEDVEIFNPNELINQQFKQKPPSDAGLALDIVLIYMYSKRSYLYQELKPRAQLFLKHALQGMFSSLSAQRSQGAMHQGLPASFLTLRSILQSSLSPTEDYKMYRLALVLHQSTAGFKYQKLF